MLPCFVWVAEQVGKRGQSKMEERQEGPVGDSVERAAEEELFVCVQLAVTSAHELLHAPVHD